MAGKLYIISAPSGAGKTSLAQALIAREDNIEMSVSHTTRSQRDGEEHGKDYYFVDQDEFFSMVERGVFLEYAEVYGNYYGTSRLAVEESLGRGVSVLLDIDWQGARSVREQMPNAVSITVLPPSIEELENRLRGRGSDSDEVIERRMRQAIDEMMHCRESEFIILNDEFNEALEDLTLIVSGESDSIRPLNVNLDELIGA